MTSRQPKENLIVCKHCGEVAENHHEYEAWMPEGCQCDPGEWDRYVLDVCDEFRGEPGKPCAVCEHDEQCHARTS